MLQSSHSATTSPVAFCCFIWLIFSTQKDVRWHISNAVMKITNTSSLLLQQRAWKTARIQQRRESNTTFRYEKETNHNRFVLSSISFSKAAIPTFSSHVLSASAQRLLEGWKIQEGFSLQITITSKFHNEYRDWSSFIDSYETHYHISKWMTPPIECYVQAIFQERCVKSCVLLMESISWSYVFLFISAQRRLDVKSQGRFTWCMIILSTR